MGALYEVRARTIIHNNYYDTVYEDSEASFHCVGELRQPLANYYIHDAQILASMNTIY